MAVSTTQGSPNEEPGGLLWKEDILLQSAGYLTISTQTEKSGWVSGRESFEDAVMIQEYSEVLASLAVGIMSNMLKFVTGQG